MSKKQISYKNKDEFYRKAIIISTQPNEEITTCYDLERVGRMVVSTN